MEASIAPLPVGAARSLTRTSAPATRRAVRPGGRGVGSGSNTINAGSTSSTSSQTTVGAQLSGQSSTDGRPALQPSTRNRHGACTYTWTLAQEFQQCPVIRERFLSSARGSRGFFLSIPGV